MTQKIYDQHQAAFAAVSAYVIVGTDNKGAPDRKATVAFKFGKGGRVTCFLHVFGGPMVRGHADGGGYDKQSAAAASAAARLNTAEYYPESQADVGAIRGALLLDNGSRWDDQLRAAGFQAFQAV